MDFYIDSTQQYPRETTNCPGMNPVLRILEEIFDPTGTPVDAFKNCVLISLDAEYDIQNQHISQIGVARLDTREIHKADDECSDLARSTLSSRQFLLRKPSVKKGQYLFGSPERCYGQSVESLLLSIFQIVDPNTTGLRNIVLIGHSIRNDIQVIRKATNLDILALPMIKAIIDTSPLINRVYHVSSRYHSLRNTCTLLGMYKRNIHTAGNDAMYALKALLLIFCYYKEQKQDWDFIISGSITDRALLYRCHLEAIRRIGRCNNGIDRYSKKRKSTKRHGLSQPKNEIQRQNKLDIDVIEGEDMSRLFDWRTLYKEPESSAWTR